MRSWPAILLLTLSCLPTAVRADGRPPADFQPDPRSVQRYGPAYRYPQAGWIVLHVEGEPYERGVQHGRLLAPEIAAHVRCFAMTQGAKDPAAAWKQTRTLVNALFLRRYAKEYLEEMKGIADGASAAGARFDNRAIDLTDVVALNAWPEVMTLDRALDATPTGLEGIRFPLESPTPKPLPKPSRCSAFAATGPATKDGKVVFGHITMFSLYPSNFYNVWLDVKPAKGHRVFMQSFPAGIQSGMDYYYNDVGLLCCETTISQTRFDGTGTALASRIRQAMQYADSIDKAAEILKEGNNGLYTNEWLLADVKTNEIAMLELGTHKTKLSRSSKGEWFGGTEGFYWGCNNTKDLEVRLETLATTDGQPASTVWRPSDRDKKWLELYDRYKGKMDEGFGKVAFTTAPIAAYHSVDAKFTTTDLAKGLKTWALFGPPLERTWQPTFDERQRFPEVQPLVSNPWTVLHAGAPTREKEPGPFVFDLHDPEDGRRKLDSRPAAQETTGRGGRRFADAQEVPAWHGTLLPRSDADTWLVTAFAAYERIVATENAMRKRGDGKLSPEDRDRLAVALFQYRSEYELGRKAHPEMALVKTKADVRQSDWHRVASGKGVLLLHALRGELGAEKFAVLMEDFGKRHAGQRVGTEEFRAFVEKAADRKLDDFFDHWLQETGLPRPKGNGKSSEGVTGLDGGPFGVQTFFDELEQTLIVYGTEGEAPTNREAALELQKAIVERGSNITVPVKSDREVTKDELMNHHLLLVGRPDTNGVVARFRAALPVAFGSQSFAVRGETYAHANSGVIVAAENPVNGRFSLVVAAGMSPAATLRVAPLLARGGANAEVVLYPSGAPSRALVVPAKEGAGKVGLIAPGARLEKLAGGFKFTEGPAADAKGNVFFTDQPNNRIHKWSTDGKLSTFLEPCGRSNGLCFDAKGNLWACADEKNELWSIDSEGKVTVVVKDYKGQLLNGPNDVWVRPDGGLYFTDPYYFRDYWKRGPKELETEGVYYLTPDRKTLTRVADDLQQPNGIIGTPDGKTLYVADIKGNKTYAYDVQDDGTLKNKRLFCKLGSDGMTIDDEGNVYLTGKGVTVFDRDGKEVEHVAVDEPWTANVCFGGKDRQTLFITASAGFYGLRMRVKGVGSQ